MCFDFCVVSQFFNQGRASGYFYYVYIINYGRNFYYFFFYFFYFYFFYFYYTYYFFCTILFRGVPLTTTGASTLEQLTRSIVLTTSPDNGPT